MKSYKVKTGQLSCYVLVQCWVLLSLCQHDLYLAQISRSPRRTTFLLRHPRKVAKQHPRWKSRGAFVLTFWHLTFQTEFVISDSHTQVYSYSESLLLSSATLVLAFWSSPGVLIGRCWHFKVPLQGAPLHVMWQAGISFLFFQWVSF